ncbi:putative phenylalanine N-monooxygenase [Helianthus annuus]|nr:putative phenylalanine N-monooxygenase [Helianthus annuus]
MMNNPKIFDKAVHELDSVVGKHKLVHESDLHHLNYIKACVKEALRLHPVAPFNLPHVTTADSTVAGYLIPMVAKIATSPRLIAD